MRRGSLSTLWGTCSPSRPSGLEYRLTLQVALHPGLLASSPPRMLGIAVLFHTASHLSQALVHMLPTDFHLAALTILEIPRGFTAEPALLPTQLHACGTTWLNYSTYTHTPAELPLPTVTAHPLPPARGTSLGVRLGVRKNKYPQTWEATPS